MGFSGMRRFVARFNFSCNLIGNRFVIPHDTIPSTTEGHVNKPHHLTVIKIVT